MTTQNKTGRLPSGPSNGTIAAGGLSSDLVELLIAEHRDGPQFRLERLWAYYRNELLSPRPGFPASLNPDRPYRLPQEQGLPARLTGFNADGTISSTSGNTFGGARKEIVIENDIAWRIHVMVDFMFGRPFALQSLAGDPVVARHIETFLRTVFEANGGLSFFQDLALLGSIYGHVDILVTPASAVARQAGAGSAKPAAAMDIPGHCGVRLDLVEAPRAIPLLNPDDYRLLDGYIINYAQATHRIETPPFWSRIKSRFSGRAPVGRRSQIECTQVWTPVSHALYRGPAGDRLLIDQSVNRLGRIPVVHIQNLPQPFYYPGLSEVEPLIPLQDELNIRLSDRANRVTFQSFKMYLGKAIDQFTERPVGPGQMWATDNLDAEIQEFGGDAASPSEESHIAEIREALDKTSCVSPVAAGLLRDRVGNLTSENALRIVLMGLLAKTERKRVTYGAGIQQLAELILHTADATGLFPNHPADRAVALHWPSPLPENQTRRLRDAMLKMRLGVPREQVLAELGYTDK